MAGERRTMWRGIVVSIAVAEKHLVDVAGIRGILSPLIHRGGLRAQILADGAIAVGDPIAEVS